MDNSIFAFVFGVGAGASLVNGIFAVNFEMWGHAAWMAGLVAINLFFGVLASYLGSR